MVPSERSETRSTSKRGGIWELATVESRQELIEFQDTGTLTLIRRVRLRSSVDGRLFLSTLMED